MTKKWAEIFESPRSLELYIIHTGFVHMSGDIHFNKKSPQKAGMPGDNRFNPVYCFLVKHPDKGLFLFDTGLHQSFAQKKFGNFGFLLGSMVKTKTEPGWDLVSQLSQLNISTGDINTIVLSHLHLDHPSSLPNFKDHNSCRVFIDQAEINAALAPFSSFKGYIKSHLKGINYEPLVYNGPIAPFTGTCDLAGDGSIFVVRTPGHTPGHVSILLNLEGGPVLLTFDAAHRQANLEKKIPPVGEYQQAVSSLENIQSFLDEFPQTRVVYSHDPDQMDSLKKLPECYT